MWPFRRRAADPSERWSFSTPLLNLGPRSPWTVADAYQHLHVWGSTGSGKTSAVMAAAIMAMLRAGFGALFLTVKGDDTELYRRYIRAAGRERDERPFGPSHAHRFNPFDAELRRKDAGGGFTENIVAMLCTVLEVAERDSNKGGGGEDGAYFRRAVKQLMRAAVELLVLAKGRITIEELYRVVVSAPTSVEQRASEEWRQHSLCWQCILEADAAPKSPRAAGDLKLAADYFMTEWVLLSGRTRSVVLSSFTSLIDVLNRSTCRELIGTTTTLRPEDALDGALIVLDMPVKLYGELGLFLQIIWKYAFQRAMERRDVALHPRPVCIVTDESHISFVQSDQLFLSTARSSRTAVVAASQSVSNYLAALGQNSEATVDSLLGNFQTQVFCQQSDVRTNAYAAELIGKRKQFHINAGSSHPEPAAWGLFPPERQLSSGVSEVVDYQVPPAAFASLQKGGPPHWSVGTIVYQGGKRFPDTGRNWRPVTFPQLH